MFRLSRALYCVLFLILISCASTEKRALELQTPTPELFRAAGLGDLEKLATATDLQIRGSNHLGTTLLMVAARRNRLNSVDYLLSRGAAANAMDFQKQTVLHYALPVKNRFLDAAIINAGGDPSVEDEFGVVPAVMWAENRNFDLLHTALQQKEKWCCLANIKTEIQSILDETSKGRKYVPPALFLILKELE